MKSKRLIATIVIISMMAITAGCGSKEEETSEKEEQTELSEDEGQAIGKDFKADVEAGLLWINDQGRVTDKDGNVIDAYSYITANDRKSLLSDGDIMAGYTMNDDMQIIIDDAYISMTEDDASGATGYARTLLSIADPSVKGREMTVTEEEQAGGGSEIYTRIADDKEEYHSDIIYGNWWEDHQINGIPIAHYIPQSLHSKLAYSGLSTYGGYECNTSVTLDDFKFIDQDTCTVELVKGTDPDDFGTYAFYLQNCQKQTDDNGTMYFTGYIDTDYVAVYGGFDQIANGDNVFMYADYAGLSTNDIPIFVGAYAEFVEEYAVDSDASLDGPEDANTENSINYEKLEEEEYTQVTVEELYDNPTGYSNQWVEVSGTVGTIQDGEIYLFPTDKYEPAIPVRLAEGVSEPDELDNVTVKGEWRGTIGEVDFHMFLWAESIETAE